MSIWAWPNAWDALWAHGRRTELALPATGGLPPLTPKSDTPDLFRAVWTGEASMPTVTATIEATIALGLLALGSTDGQEQAAQIWAARY